MPQRRRTIAVVLLAVLSRAAAVLVLQSHTVPRSTFEHGEIAANLLAGRGFSVNFLGVDGPTSQQAPVYPFVVAGAYAIGGVETPTALLILELGQAALGGVLAWLTMVLVRQLAPGRPGMATIAGLIAAVHPTLVYAATHVQVAGLAAVLVLLVLVLGGRVARTGRTADAAACGLAAAVLVLTDPILGLVAPGVAWIVARGRGGFGAVRPLAVAGALAAMGVLPWVARNHRIHGEFVPIKSTFGYAFWQGNCALSEGTDKVVRPSVEKALADSGGGFVERNRALWEARHEAGYIDDIALTDEDRKTLAALGEPARSRFLFRRAMDDLRPDPLRYPALCLRRLRYFVLWDVTNPKTRSRIYRAGHLGLTALAAVGWLAMGRDLRRRLAPTALVAAMIGGFHALTIVSARFHVPIEPLMAVWAAAGLDAIGRSAVRGRLGHVVGGGLHRVGAEGGLGRPVVGRLPARAEEHVG